MRLDILFNRARYFRSGLLIFTILLVFQPILLNAQGVVIPKDRRLALLNQLDFILNPGDWQRDLSVWPASPFHPSQEREFPNGRGGDTEDSQQAAPPPRLSNFEALDRIAPKFKPSGAIIYGEVQAIQFPSGELMRVGDVFRARIRDEVYEITLVSVSLRNYTLQLGEVRLIRPFESSTRSNQ